MCISARPGCFLLLVVSFSTSLLETNARGKNLPDSQFKHYKTYPEPRLAGGWTAAEDHFPSFVVIARDVAGKIEHVCSGVILESKFILTPADCVRDFKARAGELQVAPTIYPVYRWKEKNVIAYKVHRVCLPPSYNPIKFPDRDNYAIISLSEAIKFDTKANKANLPSKKLQVGEALELVGIGDVDARGTPAKSLQRILITFYRSERNLARSALVGQGDSCTGDTGGPLYRNENGKMELVSLVARNTEGTICDKKVKGIDVYLILDKIKELMKSCQQASRGLDDDSMCHYY